ncbi:TPA: OmpW family outer membrane protein [Escherichia coli]
MKKLTVAALAVTTLLSGSAFAHEAGEFFMRAGSATVRPTEGAGGTLGSLGGFSVTNNTQLGLTFTYMATGDIATVHHLPPTLMAQWYFGDASSKFRPYVGAGINYTTFFDNGFNDHGKEAGLSDLSLKDSWGAAGQVGVDYLINRDWLVNMSVWYMDIDTTAKYKSGVTTVKDSVRLDPWVFMFSAGYRF